MSLKMRFGGACKIRNRNIESQKRDWKILIVE